MLLLYPACLMLSVRQPTDILDPYPMSLPSSYNSDIICNVIGTLQGFCGRKRVREDESADFNRFPQPIVRRSHWDRCMGAA